MSFKRKNYYITNGSNCNGYKNVVLYKKGTKPKECGIHDLVFEAFYRRLLPNEVVHHLNSQKDCNLSINLVAVDKSLHIVRHMTGNMFNIGRKFSEEHKKKLSEAKKGKKLS